MSYFKKSTFCACRLSKRLKQAICVTFLLGITWLIGLLKVAVQAAQLGSNVEWAINILFTVCNSLQGLIIFIMFCLSRAWNDQLKVGIAWPG